MKTRTGVILAAATIAAGGVVYYQSSRVAASPTPITALVTRGDVVDSVDATGTLEAVTTVQVGSQVSGTIQSLRADFNTVVRQGQVIARLDASLFQTQVDQAAATVERLQAEVERARVDAADADRKRQRAAELLARQLLPRGDFETADATAKQAAAAVAAGKAQVVQAQAALNQARVNLQHTIITAPIAGIVISRNVDVGQTVAASMQAPTLFVIARDLSHMQVRASVNEADVGRVRPGQPVAFRVDAYPDQAFAGVVSQIRLQPVVEQNVVSYITVIDVANPGLVLKPGMTANVTIEIARENQVLRVPTAALRFRPTAVLLEAFGGDATTVPGAESGRNAGRSAAPGRAPESARPTADDRANRDTAHGDAARVWILRAGRLVPVIVTTGVNDGATTTAIRSGNLSEGDVVVTGVAAASTAGAQSASPLLPFGGRGRASGARQPSAAGGAR